MLASHLHLMKYLPPQDYTTPPKLFSWPNMAIIPKVTNWNGTQDEGGFAFVNPTSGLTQRLACQSPVVRIALLGHGAA